jgi:hypothetical protein
MGGNSQGQKVGDEGFGVGFTLKRSQASHEEVLFGIESIKASQKFTGSSPISVVESERRRAVVITKTIFPSDQILRPTVDLVFFEFFRNYCGEE